MGKIKLKINLKYCIAFYLLIMLYASLHELIHHFSAYFICGDWGYKSFNYFETACEGTRKSWYATYTGPIFSFIMMYVGMYFLKSPIEYKKQLGFATIFAQLPLQRMAMPFFKMNDEYIAMAQLFGNTEFNYWLVIILVWAICLPPLISAFKKIANSNRFVWFLFYLVLFPYLLWGPFFGILEYLMVNKGILNQQFIGIGLLFIMNEIVTIILFIRLKKFIDPHVSAR
ncbi:hypothetical protein [Flagellimonas beolgyonensis]|uniref:hypothetical protein n=1 Tax=Flagellimonas beolgyonensis TaxID=864064 RepID=UPI003D65A4F5